MTDVFFALLREGSGDDALSSVIRQLIVSAGANSASGDALPFTGTVKEKLTRTIAAQPSVNMVFVHRDSDDADPEPRYAEISAAANELRLPPPHVVAVVPVRMTEAWLLVDESSIRQVAGSPSGRAPLNLPKIHEVEQRADPKAILREALILASGHSGRRLERFRRELPSHKRTLLERLDPDGPVRELASFQRLTEDIEAAVATVCVDEGEP